MMPKISENYRDVQPADIPYIVDIHTKAFPGFFMTTLGPKFLEKYYRLVLDFNDRVFLVKEGKDCLEGFVSGFLNPAQFYLGMRRRRTDFLGAVLVRICTHPWLLPRLFASYAQARNSSHEEDPGCCELSSIAVPPDLAGRGIGKGLMKAFVEAIKGRANSISLTTDAVGNDGVNHFYRSLGFSLEGSYERSKGRKLNKYRLDLKI